MASDSKAVFKSPTPSAPSRVRAVSRVCLAASFASRTMADVFSASMGRSGRNCSSSSFALKAMLTSCCPTPSCNSYAIRRCSRAQLSITSRSSRARPATSLSRNAVLCCLSCSSSLRCCCANTSASLRAVMSRLIPVSRFGLPRPSNCTRPRAETQRTLPSERTCRNSAW